MSRTDAEKYAALRKELEDEGALEPREAEPPEPEQYDPEQHGVPEAPQREEPQPQQQPEQIPDINEDPVQHFAVRMQQLENVAAHQHQAGMHRQLHDFVNRSEDAMRSETRGDYQEAVEYLERSHRARLASQLPDGQQTDILAHQYGLPNAAALRDAVLNRDRESVISHALQNGRDPAADYYSLAQQYGYRPKVAFTKSQTAKLLKAAEEGGKEFDALWEKYAKAERKAEEARRR